MNWDTIKILIAIHRTGSVTKAAETLSINATTVLRRLATLEQETGLKLFTRTPSGYVMTSAGESLWDNALAIEKAALVFQRKAMGKVTDAAGTLTVALPPPGSLDMMPMIARFQRQYPQIALHLNFASGVSDLNKMAADVALRYTNEPPLDYVGYKLLQFDNGLYVSKQYAEDYGPIRSLADIQHWVSLEFPGLSDHFERWVEQHNPEAIITLRCNSAVMARDAVALNMGAAFISKHIADESNQILPLDLHDMNTDIGLWVLSHQDLRFQPRVKVFVDFLRQALPLRYPDYSIH